ncbi:hypothetical protein TNIN_156361 [Trichonephila inaurata madagascariensis]|uniref:Uncharacterized protein n=1 Tax=Trichonephila inaurata madagascariensis TaxID=2747483 RepID=A0A8X6X5Z2_9ARAC|nr:hypothetical protein TNIN_156361 [Trichonephila inaurata madagascariensis]
MRREFFHAYHLALRRMTFSPPAYEQVCCVTDRLAADITSLIEYITNNTHIHVVTSLLEASKTQVWTSVESKRHRPLENCRKQTLQT